MKKFMMFILPFLKSLKTNILGIYSSNPQANTCPSVQEKKEQNKKVIVWSHIANASTAVFTVGLAVLGVIGGSLATEILIGSAIIIGLLGVAGKVLDKLTS